MNHTAIFVSVGIVCLIAVAFTGCLGHGPANTPAPVHPNPLRTPVQVGHIVVSEEQNTATVSVNQGSIITVMLKENPTTGYQWNLTATTRLLITNDSYIPWEPTGKLVGSGRNPYVGHFSDRTRGPGISTALYKRSWESVQGHDRTAFSMTVVVQ